jgi:hypothetical protein
MAEIEQILEWLDDREATQFLIALAYKKIVVDRDVRIADRVVDLIQGIPISTYSPSEYELYLVVAGSAAGLPRFIEVFLKKSVYSDPDGLHAYAHAFPLLLHAAGTEARLRQKLKDHLYRILEEIADKTGLLSLEDPLTEIADELLACGCMDMDLACRLLSLAHLLNGRERENGENHLSDDQTGESYVPQLRTILLQLNAELAGYPSVPAITQYCDSCTESTTPHGSVCQESREDVFGENTNSKLQKLSSKSTFDSHIRSFSFLPPIAHVNGVEWCPPDHVTENDSQALIDLLCSLVESLERMCMRDKAEEYRGMIIKHIRLSDSFVRDDASLGKILRVFAESSKIDRLARCMIEATARQCEKSKDGTSFVLVSDNLNEFDLVRSDIWIQAENILTHIENPEKRVSCLANIAASLYRLGYNARAHHYLARATNSLPSDITINADTHVIKKVAEGYVLSGQCERALALSNRIQSTESRLSVKALVPACCAAEGDVREANVVIDHILNSMKSLSRARSMRTHFGRSGPRRKRFCSR